MTPARPPRYTVRMTDADPTPTDPVPPAPPPASPEPAPPAADHRALYVLAAVLLVSLAFGAWGAWTTFRPGAADGPAQLRRQQARIEALEQRVATLARSDQISRDANTGLQVTLAERDEEIAALRADVAFYERLVGATGQRRGLAVHGLQLEPQGEGAWHFTATLTQNLNRGAVSRGDLVLAVEGTRNGAPARLAWTDLRPPDAAEPGSYSFKYFQEVEGDILLPPGFTPLRVVVRAEPAGGSPVEKSFTWGEVAAGGSPGA